MRGATLRDSPDDPARVTVGGLDLGERHHGQMRSDERRRQRQAVYRDEPEARIGQWVDIDPEDWLIAFDEPDPDPAAEARVVIRSRFSRIQRLEAFAAAGHDVVEDEREPVENVFVARHGDLEFGHDDGGALDGRRGQPVEQVGDAVEPGDHRAELDRPGLDAFGQRQPGRLLDGLVDVGPQRHGLQMQPQVHGGQDPVGHREVDGGLPAALDPGNRRRADPGVLRELVDPESACRASLTDERSGPFGRRTLGSRLCHIRSLAWRRAFFHRHFARGNRFRPKK
jgi:hypothetical protein